MTIKHKIKIDKENKVLTLLVDVPKKVFERDENLSFNGADAWELVKNTRVKDYKVNYKKNGLVVDNWLRCNHTGAFVFLLEEERSTKVKPPRTKLKSKSNDNKPNTKSKKRKPPVKKNKD